MAFIRQAFYHILVILLTLSVKDNLSSLIQREDAEKYYPKVALAQNKTAHYISGVQGVNLIG